MVTESDIVEHFRQLDNGDEDTRESPIEAQVGQLPELVQDVISPSCVSHHSLPNHTQFNGNGQLPLPRDSSSSDDWQENVANGQVMNEPLWNPLNDLDLTNYSVLDNAFTPADWAFITPVPPFTTGYNRFRIPPAAPNALPQSPVGLRNPLELHPGGFTTSAGLNDADRQFLVNQGCFQLPPTPILRQILRYYFQFVQPNLPLVDEQPFAPVWTEDNFTLDGFSFVVFRAMLFSAIHVSPDTPASLHDRSLTVFQVP